jgi:hypothetical protein
MPHFLRGGVSKRNISANGAIRQIKLVANFSFFANRATTMSTLAENSRGPKAIATNPAIGLNPHSPDVSAILRTFEAVLL